MANPNPNQSLVKYDNAILVSTTKDKKGKKGKKGGKEQVSVFICSAEAPAVAVAPASHTLHALPPLMLLCRSYPPLTASQRRQRIF